MRRIAIVAMALFCTATARAETKAFKDWLVGCDNTLTCVALGIPHEDGDPIGYVRLARAGGAAEQPSATVVVYSEGAEGAARIVITIDGKRYGAGPVLGTSDGAYARATFDGAEATAFIKALVNARAMSLQRVDGDSAEDPVAVSLAGSSAALRYADAAQKRDGGVTALVAKGAAPASAVPAAPPVPVVAARRITALTTLPARPASLPAPSEDDCFNISGDDRFMAFDLGAGKTLWGVCAVTGAYNFTFDFYIDENGKTRPASFAIEGRSSELAMDGSLTNPWLSEDGLRLEASGKGRGIGDCGDFQSWAWDGEAFRLLSYKVMEQCRGIAPDDWIPLYTATPG